MKTKISLPLLCACGILLVALISGCGGGHEQQFKIIESQAYSASNEAIMRDYFLDKYFKRKAALENSETIMEPYWSDVAPIITLEMKKKMPAVGLAMVVKVDIYNLFGTCCWKGEGWEMKYDIYKN